MCLFFRCVYFLDVSNFYTYIGSDEMSKTETSDQTSKKANTRWGQERRLEFIEYRLQWDGYLNRSDLTSFFGISVPQSSLDLAEYLKRAPENLIYDLSTKVYRVTSTFTPIFASTALERYLEDLLRVAINPEVPYGSFLGWHPSTAVVPRPWRRIDVSTLVTLVKAVRETRALYVQYISFSEPNPVRRTITAHAFVTDGYRWHVRAYCHKNGDFRDFLLSRILKLEEGEVDQSRDQDDYAWNHFVKIILTTHPDLQPAHREVIEFDYGMQYGECVLECRQALLFYVLQQLNLLDDDLRRSPKAQQVILKNRNELKEFLPKTHYR